MSSTNIRSLDPAALYAAIKAKQAEGRARRIENSTTGFTDLDADGRKAYKRAKQAERRARIAAQQAKNGAAVFSAETMKAALIDAVMALAAAGDERADPILQLASTAFAVPEAAESTIRNRAKKHRARVLRVE